MNPSQVTFGLSALTFLLPLMLITREELTTWFESDHVNCNLLKINGGADGIRTRDLRRDRPAF